MGGKKSNGLKRGVTLEYFLCGEREHIFPTPGIARS